MFDIRKAQERVLFDAISNRSDLKTAEEIVYGYDGLARDESNPTWVKSTMHRLENKFDFNTIKQIRMDCQCGYGMEQKLTLLQKLKSSASNLEDFVHSDEAKKAGLFCREGELYLQFFFCPCPMLADVDQLESKTWCQCTTGYSKVLFEKAFGCDVDVNLLKSIKSGDDICLMKIIPNGLSWE